MSVLKDFVRKHMKTDTVIVCPELNAFIWERGSKHPPGKVGVVALKTTVNDVERTFVNLVEVGVSKQMELYGKNATSATSPSAVDVKSKEVKKEKTEKTSEKEETKEVVSKKKVEAEEPAKKEDEK